MLGFAPLAAAPLGATGEAGASYDASFADSASVSDIYISQAVFPTTQSETASVFDTVQVGASIFSASTADTLVGSDTVSTAVDFGVVVDGVATGLDTVSSLATFVPFISESVVGSDTFQSIATLQASVSDTVQASDTSVAYATYVSIVSEQTTASELETTIAVLNSALAETVVGADAVATIVNLNAQIAEIVTGNMSTTVAASIFNAQISETVSVLEQFLTTAVLFAYVTNSAVAADQLVSRLLWEVISDTQDAQWATIGDNQTGAWGVIPSVQASGWVNINDTQQPAWGIIDDSQSTPWTPVQTQT